MIDPSQIICRARDAQALGYCVRGTRNLWKSEVGEVTFRDFVRNGVSAQWLLDTGNPYAIRLAKYVMEQHEQRV